MKLRKAVLLTAVGLSTSCVLGVPSAFAASLSNSGDVVHCVNDGNLCGEQSNPPWIIGGQASAWGLTYNRDGMNSIIGVVENYETNHWWGWSTDNSWSSGNKVASLVEQQGLFNCSGGTYEFYSRSYLDLHQAVTQGGNVFTCKS